MMINVEVFWRCGKKKGNGDKLIAWYKPGEGQTEKSIAHEEVGSERNRIKDEGG